MDQEQIRQYIIDNFYKSSYTLSYELGMMGVKVSPNSIRTRKKTLKKSMGGQLELVKPNALKEQCDKLGINHSDVESAWIKGKDFSLQVIPKIDQEKIFSDFLKGIEKKAPREKKMKVKASEPFLFVYAPSDIHIGKYAKAEESGNDYNIEKSLKQVAEASRGLLDRVSNYQLDQIVLVGGNDALHIDTPKGTTTSGTVMDYQGLWWELVDKAFWMYVDIIEEMLTVAPVYVPWVVSNHDFTLGSCVGKMLKAYYSKNPNVTFDCSMAHRKYFNYGKNLLGFSHGDGAKMEDLPLIMANECPAEWSNTMFRYFYLGHIHHHKKVRWLSGKDFVGVTVQYLRSPSCADRWHSTNGFINTPAIEGFIHHPTQGQVSSHTYYLR